MSAKTAVPDAWEDDWEAQADKQIEEFQSEPPISSAKTTKAERRARQAELNKKLWAEAEAPTNFHFLDARNDVPLKTAFKPAVKVLSRKPAPKVVTRNDPVSGAVSQLTIPDDGDDDDESEDDARKPTLSLEERKQKAQREREEKQRKYEEVRERLFGTTTTAGGGAAGSGTSSPTGNVTPPRAGSRAKNRGARGGDGRPSSSSSSSSKVQTRQLYDPSYTVKPDSVYIQRRDTPDAQAAQREEQPDRGKRTFVFESHRPEHNALRDLRGLVSVVQQARDRSGHLPGLEEFEAPSSSSIGYIVITYAITRISI